MLSLLKTLTIRELVSIEAPSLVGSMVIAEMLFKFHSFTLECLAFLATWLVLGVIVRRLHTVMAAIWALLR